MNDTTVEARKKAAQIHQTKDEPRVGTLSREQAAAETVMSAADMVRENVDESAFDSRPEPPEDGGSRQLTMEQIDAFRQFIMSSEAKLGAKERRDKIEAGLEDLDLATLVELKELRQRVKIAPGFVVTYRTWSGDEEQAVTRLLSQLKQKDPIYAQTMASIYELTMGVVAVNDEVLPSHLTAEKRFDSGLFEKKLDALMRYPSIVLVDMTVNLAWFRERVEELLVSPERVKNG